VLYFPTMGGLLVVGAVMFLGGMVLCFLPPVDFGSILPAGGSGATDVAAPFPWAALREAAFTMVVGLSVAVIGTWLILTYMHKIPFLHGTVLAVSQTEVAGAGAAAMLSDAVKIGDVGAAESPLRPVGKARFGERLLDVVAQGDFLARGDRVEVIAADGNRILVRKVN
jgi:membrane-bound ClpP family serine protease